MRSIDEDRYFMAMRERVFGSVEESDVQLSAVTFQLALEVDWAAYAVVGPTPKDGPLYATRTLHFADYKSVVIFFTVSADDTQITLRDLTVPLP